MMVTINTATGQVTESKFPDMLQDVRRRGSEARKEAEKKYSLDIEILLKSENPEIQALCRVLRLDGQASR